MTFNCARLLLQHSVILSKNRYRKFIIRKCSNIYQISSLPCLPHGRYFSSKIENTTDLNEFEEFEETSPDFTNIDYNALTNGDPEVLKTIKLYQLEIDMLAQQGDKVPKKLTTDQWRELLLLHGTSQRLSYLKFLWLKEIKSVNEKRKKKEKQKQYLQFLGTKEKRIEEIPTNAPIDYSLHNVTLFHRIRDTEMTRLYNFKLLQAMMFGPQILIDCGYENYMSRKEINLTFKQLLLMWSENRDHFYPFDVLFCNLSKNSPVLTKLCKVIPSIDTDPSFPFNYTSKNYLDLYPKERLVYLTPHCNETLSHYDGDSVYIIGALVDKTNFEPLSLAKAKKDGIRFAKFPIDQHLNWRFGVKSLTLNQCLGIMNDVKDGRDWPYAFRHIPKRKLIDKFVASEETERKVNKFSSKFIKEQYRRNIVYDLLLKDKSKDS